jgi:hypothetical protein
MISLKDEPQVTDAREFSMAFASAVTEATGNEEDCIAKNGDESLFALMNAVFPQVGDLIYTIHSFGLVTPFCFD